MRIALDARTLYADQRRGIGRSLLRLYRTLAELRPDWRVIAYHRDPEARGHPLARPFAEPRCIEMPGDRFDAWGRWRLPVAAWRDGAEALHCPANDCPRWSPLPTVVTIHDTIPLELPETVSGAQVSRFAQSIRAARHRANVILCPSRYTRQRLVELAGIDAARITVAPWGPTLDADDFSRTADPAAVLHEYRVAAPFVLHFGAADPRKNTRRLIEAWAMLPRRVRRQWRLLVLGLDGTTQQRLMKVTHRLGVHRGVVLHGFARERDVPALLSSAELLAYPSLAEGFGLPILEAFAARTAVLTSDATSLSEVAGDAALCVDPHRTLAIHAGLRTLIRDAAQRDELVARGVQRLSEFTWRTCAERFAEAIERTAGVQRRRLAA